MPLTYDQFFAHLERLGYPEGTLTHAAELYLCAACALADRAGLDSFEKLYVPALCDVLRLVIRQAHAVEDVLQDVRSRLFVGRSPKITTYRGQGSLRGWLRSIAMHAAHDYLRAVRRRRARMQKLADSQVEITASNVGSNGCLEERAFASDRAYLCERAWCCAVGSLDAMERQLLHHHFVSGLSIDILGQLYSVHRATIARRVRVATSRVQEHVRALLSARYRELNGKDLDAIVLDACAEIDVAQSLGAAASSGTESCLAGFAAEWQQSPAEPSS
ncbi:MAG: sigma-70 family RNA polymerase sigma factor [Deltaproteobacteria bacterium]